MLIVENDPVKVETDLLAGAVACPACEGRLAPWGFARRRTLRGEAGPVALRPRRGRCCSCWRTQVFLPDVALGRRVDTAGVIGRALSLAAGGAGHRRVATRVGRTLSTVRGWLRRFAAVAERVRAHFTWWAVALDPMLGPVTPAGSSFADAVAAIGAAASAAVRRLGPRPAWQVASVLSAGGLLSNTSCPWVAPG